MKTATPDATPPGAPAASTGAAPGETTLRILVADSDPATRNLVVTLVTQEGYGAVSVPDGREAYRQLQPPGGDFAACVFDSSMPHIQGPELIRYMRSEKRLLKIPVVLLTAEPALKEASDRLAAGFVVFLSKPFTPLQFQIMLRMLLKKSRGE